MFQVVTYLPQARGVSETNWRCHPETVILWRRPLHAKRNTQSLANKNFSDLDRSDYKQQRINQQSPHVKFKQRQGQTSCLERVKHLQVVSRRSSAKVQPQSWFKAIFLSCLGRLSRLFDINQQDQVTLVNSDLLLSTVDRDHETIRSPLRTYLKCIWSED